MCADGSETYQQVQGNKKIFLQITLNWYEFNHQRTIRQVLPAEMVNITAGQIIAEVERM